MISIRTAAHGTMAALTMAALTAFAATSAVAQMTDAPPPKGFWTSGFNQGISEYSTGTFDQPIDGGIRIACLPDGSATLGVQIKGAAPASGSRFLLIPATRGGRSQTFTLTANAEGDVKFARARSDRQLARLWTAFRGGNNVTVRYPDGSFSVQSLIGTTATLPARVCG